jgi:anti-sigma B factor antagonist
MTWPRAYLEVDTTERDGALVLRVRGELDVDSAQVVRRQLFETVIAEGQKVVVDLEGLDFIDSSGLTVLIQTARRVRDRGGELHLVCAKFHRLLSIAGLDQIVPVHDTLDDACGA